MEDVVVLITAGKDGIGIEDNRSHETDLCYTIEHIIGPIPEYTTAFRKRWVLQKNEGIQFPKTKMP